MRTYLHLILDLPQTSLFYADVETKFADVFLMVRREDVPETKFADVFMIVIKWPSAS